MAAEGEGAEQGPPIQVPPLLVIQQPVVQPAYLQGAQLVTNLDITEEESIRQVLHWIGFRSLGSKDSIVNDGITSFDDTAMMTEKDISSMAISFGNRTVANGRMHLGTRRIKYLKAFTHWIRDYHRVSEIPSIIGSSGGKSHHQEDGGMGTFEWRIF